MRCVDVIKLFEEFKYFITQLAVAGNNPSMLLTFE